MSAELLASAFAILLSLGCSYIPGLKDGFDGLKKTTKQMIMGLGIIVIAAAAFGLSCAGLVDVGLTCDQAGALGLAQLAIDALIANQGVYLLTKK